MNGLPKHVTVDYTLVHISTRLCEKQCVCVKLTINQRMRTEDPDLGKDRMRIEDPDLCKDRC